MVEEDCQEGQTIARDASFVKCSPDWPNDKKHWPDGSMKCQEEQHSCMLQKRALHYYTKICRACQRAALRAHCSDDFRHKARESGLDSPGKTHGDDSLVPAWPKTMPGVPRHFAL